MTMFHQRWLTLWCMGVGLFGLVLWGAGWAATDGAARAVFALFGNPLPETPDRYFRFATSLMGAVSIGWAITLYAAFRAAWALDPAAAKPVWRVLNRAVASWFVIDSVASAANGFEINVLSNAVLVVFYAIPVALSGVMSARTR